MNFAGGVVANHVENFRGYLAGGCAKTRVFVRLKQLWIMLRVCAVLRGYFITAVMLVTALKPMARVPEAAPTNLALVPVHGVLLDGHVSVLSP